MVEPKVLDGRPEPVKPGSSSPSCPLTPTKGCLT